MYLKALQKTSLGFAGLVLGAGMHTNPDGSVERDAARIAVVELKASLNTAPDVRDEPMWRVDLTVNRLTTEEVVALLAESPKPTECRATVDSAAGVNLNCQPASDSLSKFMQLSADYVLQRIENAWAHPDTASIDVLVQSSQDDVIVSYSAFAYWLRSYSVGNVTVEYIFDPPPEEAARVGARMILRFTRRLH